MNEANKEEERFIFRLDNLVHFVQLEFIKGNLKRWSRQEKSPHHVFEWVGLHKLNKQLFETPYFNMWAEYTKVCEIRPHGSYAGYAKEILPGR